MAIPATDLASIIRRVRDLSRSALWQASKPMPDYSPSVRAVVVSALMSAAEELIQAADRLEGRLLADPPDVPRHFEVPSGRSRQ